MHAQLAGRVTAVKVSKKSRPHELILVLELTTLNFYVILIIKFLSFNPVVSDSLMSTKLRACSFLRHPEYSLVENFYNALMTCPLGELVTCYLNRVYNIKYVKLFLGLKKFQKIMKFDFFEISCQQ